MPGGYAIYNNASGLILEKSKESPSPYSGINENLYYSGPTYYYVYDEVRDAYIHTISGEIISNQFMVSRAEACSIAQSEWNKIADTSLKTYIDFGTIFNPSVKSASGTYTFVGNHKNFFKDLTTAEEIGYYSAPNTNGCCGYVAAGLVLLYYDYYYADNVIENDEYLSSSGDSFVGEDFAKHLYEEIGIKELDYGSSLSARQVADVMQTYLKSERGVFVSCWVRSRPSISLVISQLKEDRPVVYCDRWDNPQEPGETTDHVIVIYGYDSDENLIAHFGWEDYSYVECSSPVFAMFNSSASTITSYD